MDQYAQMMAQPQGLLGQGQQVFPGGVACQRRETLRDLVLLLVQEKACAAEYEALDIPLPKEVKTAIAALQRKIKARHQEDMARELETARREVEELRGRQERLADAQRRVQELESKLG